MTETVIRPSMKLIKAQYGIVLLVIVGVTAASLPLGPGAFALPVLPILLLFFPARNHLRRQFTKVTIAGDKLRYDQGMLARTTRNIQLSRVQDVRVDQSMFQRMLSIGTLSVETAGETSRLTVPDIDNPQAVADAIIDAAHQAAKADKQGL
jgi:uncharacterized membrane protein YdbT with pleckstrin-like domain